MTLDHYILDENRVPKVVTLLEWAFWFEHVENRSVAYTVVGQYTVSTIFLGLDHNFGSGPPLLFESCVFDSGDVHPHPFRDGVFIDDSEVSMRYTTWAAAEAGHKQIVKGLEFKTGMAAAEMPRSFSAVEKPADS